MPLTIIFHVITVAAIASMGNLSSFSNYGFTSVDLGAPGQGIWFTTAFNSYESYSGTSMATPHVSEAAPLYKAKKSGATAAQVNKTIFAAARSTPTPLLAGKTSTGGRLNVSGFLIIEVFGRSSRLFVTIFFVFDILCRVEVRHTQKMISTAIPNAEFCTNYVSVC